MLGNARLVKRPVLSYPSLSSGGPTREKVSRHRLRITVGSRRSPAVLPSRTMEEPTPPSKGLLQVDDVYPLHLAEIDCFLLAAKKKKRRKIFNDDKKRRRKKFNYLWRSFVINHNKSLQLNVIW